jgi:uncharacterized protein YkwD
MSKMSEEARRAFREQNRWRTKRGVRSLKWSKPLYITAKAACAVIVRRGQLEHSPIWYRGIKKVFGNKEMGENIGWGQDEPSEIIDGWDNSPAHHRIMVDRDYNLGAIATVYSKKLDRQVWVAHYVAK